MIFDSHAHYDDERFNEDREAVLEKIQKEQVSRVINIGADLNSSLKSIELAKQHDFIYAAIGVHPHDVQDLKEEDLETLLGLAAHHKVVALGEIGLDYYYDNSPREIQKLWFREQIQLAKGIELPLVIHSRDAAEDTYHILEEAGAHELGGVIHCFSYSREMAERFVDLGFYIGIGGVITFPKAKKLLEVVKHIPLNKLLIETDAPYLSPEPFRGRRNDSGYLKYVIQKIAEIKAVSEEEVTKVTYDNAMKLFIDSL